MRITRALAALLLSASTAGAQEERGTPTPEVRPFVGAYVPVGAMRDEFRTATTLGAQVALETSRRFHLVGSTAWTYGHNELGLRSGRTNIWHYDAGVEGNLVRPLTLEWTWRPFVGAGAGGRTYDYRSDEIRTRRCTAGYGSLGSELERGAIALRAEARGYVSCLKSPTTGRSRTRNDLGITLGVAYHAR